MNRVRYTTSSEGAGNCTLSVPASYQGAMAARFQQLNNAYVGGGEYRQCWYMLVDADGSAWEFGRCEIDATTLYRSTGQVYESTASDARITLSAGTHAVYITRAGLEGMIVQHAVDSNGMAQSISAGAWRTAITWRADMGELSGYSAIADWPGGKALGDIETLPYAGAIYGVLNLAPYARAWRAFLSVECTPGATGGMIGAHLQVEDSNFAYDSWRADAWAPLSSGNLVVPAVCTPWMEMASGINSATDGVWKGPFYNFRELTASVSNTGAGAVDVHSKLAFEFLI